MPEQERIELTCSLCGDPIMHSGTHLSWTEAEEWAEFRFAKNPHKCGDSKLCGGFGFFPGKDKCPGCRDCCPTLEL